MSGFNLPPGVSLNDVDPPDEDDTCADCGHCPPRPVAGICPTCHEGLCEHCLELHAETDTSEYDWDNPVNYR
jgi:hypothetical protein